ncbi:Pectin lyase-like superfamily protein [Euphorbia peplus]|nr:Pectin lyase-like superfamily protein [Euphorbia peplus]
MDSSLKLLAILFTVLVVLSNVEVKATKLSDTAGGTPAPATAGAGLFDITKFGAVPNGDSLQALTKAWTDACAVGGGVRVPKGIFKTGPIAFAGPCKGPMTFSLEGTLEAPVKVDTPSWITFKHIDKLTINGGGILDGQGSQLWKTQAECSKKITTCKSKAINLRLDYVTGGLVEGITSLNSKHFHINCLGCNDVTFQKVTITAPEDSPNTAGIHIGRSKGVTITDTKIATGDDCISVGDGTSEIKMINVQCGPGHGISIGSLGLYKDEQPVSGITVQGCTMTNTTNGVRIKSWPDKYPCTASGIHFSDIAMENVGRPIVIEMMYCPYTNCNTAGPSKVKLTDVSFSGIKGTVTSVEAVKLNCMPGSCENIQLANIDLKPAPGAKPSISNCTNVKPTVTGIMNPRGC